MTDSLHREVLVPARPGAARPIAAALALAAIGVGAALIAAPAASVTHVTIAAPTDREAVPVTTQLTAPIDDSRPLPSTEVSLLFAAAGTTYVKLADLDGEALPRHGKTRLVSDTGVEHAIAVLAERDVPSVHRAWANRRVRTDGGCQATVTGFAIVARVLGDPGYAGLDGDRWTAAAVLDHGAPVLAARLDGCASARFGRDASLPAIVQLAELPADAALVDAAHAQLITSAPARETQRAWDELDQTGTWHEHEYTQFDVRVVRHPTTGTTFVSVHGRAEHGCGGPEVNLWGLFRVASYGSLVPVELRELGEVTSIAELVDLEGDGELELLGTRWLADDRVLARASGAIVERLTMPFYGCSC